MTDISLWPSDSRLVALGQSCEVVLVKQGRKEPEEPGYISETVDLTPRLAPMIADIFEDTHGVRLRSLADTEGTHPRHPWMRSRFSFVTQDNAALVECRNYSADEILNFSDPEEAIRIPPGDMAECIHQAAVYGVGKVWLAVLFGGQCYRDYEIDISDAIKDAWVQELAEVYGHIVSNSTPEPETPAQARLLWPMGGEQVLVATPEIERLCAEFKRVRGAVKELQTMGSQLKRMLMAAMRSHGEIVSPSGKSLATWKTPRDSRQFSESLLKSAMPHIHQQFMVDVPGVRNLRVK